MKVKHTVKNKIKNISHVATYRYAHIGFIEMPHAPCIVISGTKSVMYFIMAEFKWCSYFSKNEHDENSVEFIAFTSTCKYPSEETKKKPKPINLLPTFGYLYPLYALLNISLKKWLQNKQPTYISWIRFLLYIYFVCVVTTIANLTKLTVWCFCSFTHR